MNIIWFIILGIVALFLLIAGIGCIKWRDYEESILCFGTIVIIVISILALNYNDINKANNESNETKQVATVEYEGNDF